VTAVTVVVEIQQPDRASAAALRQGVQLGDQSAAHEVVDHRRGGGTRQTGAGHQVGAADGTVVDQVAEHGQRGRVGVAVGHGHLLRWYGFAPGRAERMHVTVSGGGPK